MCIKVTVFKKSVDTLWGDTNRGQIIATYKTYLYSFIMQNQSYAMLEFVLINMHTESYVSLQLSLFSPAPFACDCSM